MSNPKRLFGTNGIRGIPGKDLTLEFIMEMGYAIGKYFGKGPIVVGYDGRSSGPTIAKALESALMASAIDVFEAGLLPTPALQYGVGKLGYAAGVMITASHNPPQYNGIKVVAGDGVEVSRSDELEIEDIFYRKSYQVADWKTAGRSATETRAVDTYISGVLSQVDIDSIRRRNFKVVVDPGNGAQALTAPYVLEELGCRVFSINCHINPDFPGRGPEPTPDVLGNLSEAVKVYNADFGVAYDGDGDRSIFSDERGIIHWGDRTGAIISDYVLSKKPGSTLVTTVSTSQIIDQVAEKHQAKLVRTKVGSVDVSRAMIVQKALCGLEENGGYFYAPHIPVRDGAMTTALLLEVLTQNENAFSNLLGALPQYYQKKVKIECPRESVRKVMSEVQNQISGEVDTTDGVKTWIDKNTWVLIRPSGTEPIIRLFAESDDKNRLDTVVDKFTGILKRASENF